MTMIRRLTVFASATPGVDPGLLDFARDAGRGLAARGIAMVYGGGGTGLMNALADGVLGAGGEVIGVIPKFLFERELGRNDLTTLHVVDSMHQRKTLMAELGDAFLALPGGIGTLEELFEAWTWRQIGITDKPVGLLNPKGFWDRLVLALEGIAAEGYIPRRSLDGIVVSPDLEGALAGLESRRDSARRATEPAVS